MDLGLEDWTVEQAHEIFGVPLAVTKSEKTNEAGSMPARL